MQCSASGGVIYLCASCTCTAKVISHTLLRKISEFRDMFLTIRPGNRGLIWLVWLLVTITFWVTYVSHQDGEKIAVLKERLRVKEEAMAQLETQRDKERSESEARWDASLKTSHHQNAQSKTENLDEIEKKIKQEIKERAARTFPLKLFINKNLLPDVEKLFKYDPSEVKLLSHLDQDDPILVKHVQNKLWITPSPRHVPYKLDKPGKKDRSEGQLAPFLDIFQNTTDGYFIECGALDGEDFSNSLDLEERYNWTGTLIEASLINFQKLVTKKRKSVLVPACLSLEKHPTTVQFQQDHAVGKIVNSSNHTAVANIPAHVVSVHCVPFYTIYKAIGRSVIDLFILDIEGNEVEVLLTIPWDKVNILVMIAEFSHGKYSNDFMRDYMFKQDYRLYNGTKRHYWPNENYIFIKKGSKYDVKHP